MKNIKSNKGITNAILTIIIVSIILLISLFIILYINNRNEQDILKSDNESNELSNEEVYKHSSEIQLILDYANEKEYININKKTAEQIVAFSHKNGLGIITNIDCSGVVDYYENDEIIYAWNILLYTEKDAFSVDISENDGTIYNITYNNKVYYTKSQALNDDNINENGNNLKTESVDWSNLDITIDGIDYVSPYTINEFINNGWKTNSNEVLEENISLDEGATIGLDHSEYSCDLNIYIENNGLNEIKKKNATIKELTIGQWANREKPLFEFYGIKAGDSKETAEKIFGKADYINTDENRGFVEYTYNTTLENETRIELILEFDISDNELYEIEIKQYLNEE